MRVGEFVSKLRFWGKRNVCLSGTHDLVKQYGFVYSEEVVSPDGAVKVIYGYSDGEKTPLTIEPRIEDCSTGEVLVDLWRAWCQGTVEFEGPGRLRIKVHEAYHRVLICEAEVDVIKKEFVLADTPRQREPLELFRQRVLELRAGTEQQIVVPKRR